LIDQTGTARGLASAQAGQPSGRQTLHRARTAGEPWRRWTTTSAPPSARPWPSSL